jgi:hypothetical protein
MMVRKSLTLDPNDQTTGSVKTRVFRTVKLLILITAP